MSWRGSEIVINIAKDFAEIPGPRYKRQGAASGESFREKMLWPALAGGRKVRVELDGVEGYSASFLEEAFGGLARRHPEILPSLREQLEIVGSNNRLIKRIWQYIQRPEAVS